MLNRWLPRKPGWHLQSGTGRQQKSVKRRGLSVGIVSPTQRDRGAGRAGGKRRKSLQKQRRQGEVRARLARRQSGCIVSCAAAQRACTSRGQQRPAAPALSQPLAQAGRGARQAVRRNHFLSSMPSCFLILRGQQKGLVRPAVAMWRMAPCRPPTEVAACAGEMAAMTAEVQGRVCWPSWRESGASVLEHGGTPTLSRQPASAAGPSKQVKPKQ